MLSSSTKARETYQRNQVQTASPGELTLMLYNGLVRNIKQAKQSIEAKQIEASHSFIIRAQDIITELMITLNMEYDISKQLMPLYDYMKQSLIEVNLKKDLDKLAEVEGMAAELRETWAQAIKLAKQP
ncbi:flagellar export chaperone FliS [Ammoniphilus oxalaticus]|uniref:Flagellar secretion chaperone FliS n=1 Tax=Ammoniphilus oxalaticus TaxID=66863 RepID=A0A419SJV3_9BACL|nr:flagellar export chaperone FliS [Ammoniphilus oxalaticus]RKD24252.1 flagellar export chaperone FliS [Ammoniphilus oxalaticus]